MAATQRYDIKDLALAEERVLGLERLLHLEQELRVVPDL